MNIGMSNLISLNHNLEGYPHIPGAKLVILFRRKSNSAGRGGVVFDAIKQVIILFLPG